jgi:hypothetical protein
MVDTEVRVASWMVEPATLYLTVQPFHSCSSEGSQATSGHLLFMRQATKSRPCRLQANQLPHLVFHPSTVNHLLSLLFLLMPEEVDILNNSLEMEVALLQLLQERAARRHALAKIENLISKPRISRLSRTT